MDYGKLNIHVVSDNSGFPIPDATVQITSENAPGISPLFSAFDKIKLLFLLQVLQV